MDQSRAKYGFKSASRTTATVLIDTHDRGKDFGSQRLDISEYITQLTIDSHIAGGGAANITMPGIDYFEDIIAAGDLVNIYLDTHRGDDNIYNRGNVRVFFGYVDAVSKSVSVSGDGTKSTMYTILCQDFAKAIRSTEVYNNPFLSIQRGDGSNDIVREELSDNLGGLALHALGIPYEGTPREVVLQGLMRCLGTGGQCILPQHYSEGLPGSQYNVNFEAPKDPLSEQIQSIKLGIATSPTVAELEKLKDSFSDLVGVIDEFDEFTKSLDGVTDKKDLLKIIKSKETPKIINFDAKLVLQNKKVKVPYRSYLSNTFFQIGPGIGQKGNDDKITYGPIDNKIKPFIEKTITKVAFEAQQSSGKFRLSPMVNHLADPAVNEDVVQHALTIFNILCLDYMEDVDGYWGDWRWMRYQGNLMGALLDGANTMINELFFDLRPMPVFDNNLSKDGLGVKTNGAIAMVPAVILREKPFTNYPHPTKGISNADGKSSIRIGALLDEKDVSTGLEKIPSEPITNDTKPYKHKISQTDQLFVSTTSPQGTTSTFDASQRGAVESILKKSLDKSVVDNIEEIDVPYLSTYDPELHKLANSGKFAVLSEVDGGLDAFKKFEGDEFFQNLPSQELPTEDFEKLLEIQQILSELSVSEKSYLKALIVNDGEIKKSLVIGGKLDQQIVGKQFGTILSLPRPVFRSPDGTRITQEKKIAVTQRVIGTIATDASGNDASFKAFSTTDPTGVSELDGYFESHNTGDNKTPNANPLLAPGSDLGSVKKTLSEAQSERWHCLDFMTIYPHDVMVETHNRGDNNLANTIELTGSLTVPTPEAQRFTLNNIIPVMTPVSIHRFGIRVNAVQTKFMDILNMGGGSAAAGDKEYDWHSGLLIRWNVLLDMWSQHNHEYVSASMTVRGMPGLRVGYRIDRPDLNLSFYVDRVSHTWSYPGLLTTQVSATRGQPIKGVTQSIDMDGNVKKVSKVLPYYPPEPNVVAGKQQRQKLGKIFRVGETEKGKRKAPPGTYTGNSLYTKVRGRDDAVEEFPVPIQGDSGDNQLPE